jgi:hypothetical protein
VKFSRARRAVPFLLLLAGLLGVTPLAWGQYASKTGDVVGTVGGACTSSANTYGWPDTNGDILKCVANVWTLVTQPSTAAGSTGYVQFNNANALAADSNLFWDNTNKRLGIGTPVPGVALDVYNGSIRLNNVNSGKLYMDSDNSGYIYSNGSNNILIHNSSGDELTITGATTTINGATTFNGA